VIGGLGLLLAVESEARPARARAYLPKLQKIFDEILERGTNEDGLMYNALGRKGRLSDGWGYNYVSYLAHDMVTGEDRYTGTVRETLEALAKPLYQNYNWENGSIDGFADSVEGAIYLVNRLPVPEAIAWIDQETTRHIVRRDDEDHLWSTYKLDSNGVRTALMHALMHTRGVTAHPWRQGMQLGAVETAAGGVAVTVAADTDWSGRLVFDIPRHRESMGFTRDWPRMNTMPEWFTVEPSQNYAVTDPATGTKTICTGAELHAGLAVKVEAGSPRQLLVERAAAADVQPWTFCSIPDFLNFDIEYPQEGWEDALGFILGSMKKDDAAFVMVPGDLVMGHWGPTKDEVWKWADLYYPQWTQRFADLGLEVYTALGDHELGDNPWRGAKAKLVPTYRAAFRKHLKMPLNGPDAMKGTAFYWVYRNALFVSVDVFEEGRSDQGEIAAGVTGEQLEWFESLLSRYRDQVRHIVVMGHTPVLRPVRTYSSSGMLTVEGRESAFWQTMARYGVDLYLCGEVHAVTCTRRDGVQQIAHGGLLGRTTRPNYLRVVVHPDRLELDLREIELVNGKGRLPQHQKRRGPWDTLTITEESQERGFQSIGQLKILQRDGEKQFVSPTGFFDPEEKPGP
jgi:hypothetical protein